MKFDIKIIKFSALLVALIFVNNDKIFGQSVEEKFIIFFNDKPSQKFDAYSYFTPKAIENKVLRNLPLHDWYDLPVDEAYLNQLEINGAKLKCVSRWLNAAVVFCGNTAIKNIAQLPFVASVQQQESKLLLTETAEINENPIEISRQTERMGIRKFDSLGFNGKGILIAIFDVGFSGAERHPAFEHIRKSNRIIKTFDFVKNIEDVYHGGSHGTSVFSCIAGKKDNQPLGLATEAEFLLARTEIITKEI